ncbi:hypothetical protein GJ496_009998 [Pomphorhynchus laevis]|nr:hypothetical protein GJ496_009998 [Pomphorhynchus laevis]
MSIFNDNIKVFLARSSPQDKYTLVTGIVKSRVSTHREIVAVTGDGTNDAPALKCADVGFAMGIQGTDVAKEACDIILTDDNFTSIVKALMWGRNVYDNIAKFLQFQLTANVSAGLLSVICAAAISRIPLSAIQMLWVNLVMDTLASLALASEKPTESLLDRKPYGRTRFIISPIMLRNILGHSFYQLSVMFIILFAGTGFLDTDSMVEAIKKDPSLKYPSEHFTIVFNSFVLMTLFNEINARKLHGERNVFTGVFSNWIFVAVWLGCVILQITIIMIGDIAVSVVRLRADQWMWCIFFGIGSLIYGQLLAFVPVKPFIGIVKTMSKAFRIKRKSRSKSDILSFNADDSSDDSLSDFDSTDAEFSDSAVLWYRGVNRVRVQANAVAIFRKRLQ